MAKTVGKTKAKVSGKTKTKVGIKEPGPDHVKVEKETPVGKPPKWIRMLMSLANQDMAYIKGKIYRVPHDVPVQTARSWIDSEAAVEVEGPEG